MSGKPANARSAEFSLMAPVIPDPARIVPFSDVDAFDAWMAKNHAVWPELWVQFFKKGSGVATIGYEEAVEVALCWGWIDGLKKTHDAQSYILRFTPRRPQSIWSLKNTRTIEALIVAGRMRPSGLAEVERAKADGRWDKAYAPGSEMEVPDDFLAALEAEPAAMEAYRTLNRANSFAIAFRLNAVKRPETRARKIAEYVAMLARGETLHPNGKRKSGA
jgi:uncharacterized protein YdeI (YjbR/CyaY-like superfamily)